VSWNDAIRYSFSPKSKHIMNVNISESRGRSNKQTAFHATAMPMLAIIAYRTLAPHMETLKRSRAVRTRNRQHADGKKILERMDGGNEKHKRRLGILQHQQNPKTS
jgi:hypothetical protein